VCISVYSAVLASSELLEARIVMCEARAMLLLATYGTLLNSVAQVIAQS
jgi:hypothetical protein